MRETEVKSRLLASRPRWLETVGLVLVALFAGVWSVGAQEYRGTEEARAACTGDVFRLCWSEIPNVSHIVGCLAREKHQLSAGCRAVFDHHSNGRVAHARWQKLHRFTSGSDQPQPGQLAPERHRDIATPSTEPM